SLTSPLPSTPTLFPYTTLFRSFPDNEHFFLLMQEEETPSVEVLAASDKLVYDILLFVKKKYPQTDYELFRLKEYEAKCSYRHLSDRKSTRLNSSHVSISYAVFC